MKKIKNDNKKVEFSKFLLVQESILIWIITILLIFLAFVCIFKQYFGELPWITAMVSLPWGAYAVSQAAYYKKAEKENTKDGIKYETVMAQYHTNDEDLINSDSLEEEAEG